MQCASHRFEILGSPRDPGDSSFRQREMLPSGSDGRASADGGRDWRPDMTSARKGRQGRDAGYSGEGMGGDDEGNSGGASCTAGNDREGNVLMVVW